MLTGNLLREMIDRKHLDMLDYENESEAPNPVNTGEMSSIRGVLSQNGPRALKYVDLFIPTTIEAPERVTRVIFEPVHEPVGFITQLFLDTCASRLLLICLLERSRGLTEKQDRDEAFSLPHLELIAYVDIFIPLSRGKVVRVRVEL